MRSHGVVRGGIIRLLVIIPPVIRRVAIEAADREVLGPLHSIALDHDWPKISIQSSQGAPRIDAGALGDYPTLDLSQRASASRSVSTKSK